MVGGSLSPLTELWANLKGEVGPLEMAKIQADAEASVRAAGGGAADLAKVREEVMRTAKAAAANGPSSPLFLLAVVGMAAGAIWAIRRI